MSKISESQKSKTIDLLLEGKLSGKEIAALTGLSLETVNSIKARMTMGTYTRKRAKAEISQILARFNESYINTVGARVGDYSEQDTATKFVRPLINALGWNVLSMEDMREQVHASIAESEERFIHLVSPTSSS